MKLLKYKNIIWDWNGTLLNDIEICIKAINILLHERDLPPLTEKKYRDVFTFPVRDYYENIGFDFSLEEFDIPALKFIKYYHKFLPMVGLYPMVETVLQKFKSNNFKQFILSAMEHDSLKFAVHNLGIDDYFVAIAGIGDYFAKSKIDRGIKLINDMALKRNETIMVGDTLHDMEVAEALGINCILVSQGHQNAKRLKVNENIVLNSISNIEHYI